MKRSPSPSDEETKSDLDEALQLLSSVEFTTVVSAKCPICLGWNREHGETSYEHTGDCKLARILRKYGMERKIA